jgi:hypothetical protein
MSERVTEGLALVRQACAGLESAGVVAFHSLVVAHLGEACRLADRLEDARAAAMRALSLARERGERGREADALRLLGDTARTASRSTSKQPTATTPRLSPSPRTSACARSSPTATSALANCIGKRATGAKAQEHLTTAATMYREMGMSFWLDQVEAALAPLHS